MNIPKKIIDGSYENFKNFIMRESIFKRSIFPHQNNSSLFHPPYQQFIMREKELTNNFFSTYDSLKNNPSPASRLPEEKESIFLKECIPSTNSKDSFSSNFHNGEQQEKNKIINDDHHPIESFFSSQPPNDEQDHILRSPHQQFPIINLQTYGVDIIK